MEPDRTSSDAGIDNSSSTSTGQSTNSTKIGTYKVPTKLKNQATSHNEKSSILAKKASTPIKGKAKQMESNNNTKKLDKNSIVNLSSPPSVPPTGPGSGDLYQDSTSSITTTTCDRAQLVETDSICGGDTMNPGNGINSDGGELKEAKSSIAHASFNYINSILGSGVIGMPYALHQAGVGMGLILMVFVAYITDYSLLLMIKAGELSGSSSYQDLMEAAFGRIGFYILTLLQLVYPLIAMISYNIIVGDTLPKVLGYVSPSIHFQREAIVLIVTLIVTLPLSLYRDVARLSRVSLFSLVSIGFIMVAILIRLDTSPQPWTTDSWQFVNTGLVQACGVFAFAFMCHHNTFMLYGSLEESSEANWSRVTHVSIGTSLIVSLVFGLGGYATFTGQVQGDLLENYCPDDDLINISRFLFCITILLTFPLECFVVRDVIEKYWWTENQPSTRTRHFSLTLLIVLLAYVISVSTDCLGVVLELNGVLAAIPLAYILPALCYLKLEPTGSRLWSHTKLPALGIATFGILISGIGLILLMVNGQSSNCSHGHPLPYCSSFHNETIPRLSVSPILPSYP